MIQMGNEKNMNNTSDREIVVTRILNATRERVFKAWTDPIHLANWWGPKDFRNTFDVFEPKPSGAWQFTMHGPDGTDYKNESEFVEVSAGKIVFDHITPPKFRMITTLEDQPGKTKIIFRQVFDDVEDCRKLKKFLPEANEQNMDRLEVELSKMS